MILGHFRDHLPRVTLLLPGAAGPVSTNRSPRSVRTDELERQTAAKTPMKPRVSVITLGVEDLERALRFYRDGLGLPTQGIVGQEFEEGAVAFFDLQPGLTLALWPRRSIARDSGLPLGASSPTDLTLGHNVSARDEVDAVMQQAKDAGAVIVKAAQETFWGGYAGYFQDPDGHLWEVVWNPQRLPED